MIRKITQCFYTSYVVVTFVICFVSAFPFMILCSIGKTASGRKNVIKISRECFRFWLFIIGMPLKLIGKKPVGRYLFVANHTSYLDTITIFPAIPGHFRALGKTDMEKIPLFGYFYKQAGILVDRKNAKSKTTSMWQMLQHIKGEGSMLIFPEGTFNETDKPLKEFYDGAFHLAITAQTPILPMIFPDALYRWHYSAWWKFSPGRNRVIYLDPVPVAGLTLEDLPTLKQQVYTVIENAMIKYRQQ